MNQHGAQPSSADRWVLTPDGLRIILIRNKFLSADPAMLGWIADYAIGDQVMGMFGWQSSVPYRNVESLPGWLWE